MMGRTRAIRQYAPQADICSVRSRVLLRALAHAPWARARWTPLTAPGYTDDRKNRTLARCREFLANVPSPKQKSRSSPSTGRHHGARTRIDLGEDCRGA